MGNSDSSASKQSTKVGTKARARTKVMTDTPGLVTKRRAGGSNLTKNLMITKDSDDRTQVSPEVYHQLVNRLASNTSANMEAAFSKAANKTTKVTQNRGAVELAKAAVDRSVRVRSNKV